MRYHPKPAIRATLEGLEALVIRGYLRLRTGNANTDRFQRKLHLVVDRSASALSACAARYASSANHPHPGGAVLPLAPERRKS